MSRRFLLSESFVRPGMWRVDYRGTESPFYIPPGDPVYIPTNIYFDFEVAFPIAFITSDELHGEGLKLRSILAERGQEIRISFTRRAGDAEWLRLHENACLGFIVPATFF